MAILSLSNRRLDQSIAQVERLAGFNGEVFAALWPFRAAKRGSDDDAVSRTRDQGRKCDSALGIGRRRALLALGLEEIDSNLGVGLEPVYFETAVVCIMDRMTSRAMAVAHAETVSLAT